MYKLNGISEELMNINFSLICNTNYKIDELKEESELKYIGTSKITVGKGRIINYIGRQGLPQGLNMSPLLAIIGLNMRPLDNLVMYADDGVYLYDTDEDLYKYFM